MREKILAQLIAKYAGVSKRALGLIADKLARKVTDDSGIDQAITDFDNAISITDFAADLQRESDLRVGEAKKEWEKKNPKPGHKTDDDDDDDDKDDAKGKGKGKKANNDEPPAWAKKLMTDLESLKADKTKSTIQQKLAEKLKGKVPEKFYSKRALPENDDDLDAFITEVETDYTDFKQGLVNEGLLINGTPPGGGGPGGGEVSAKSVQADIDRYMSKKDAGSKKVEKV